ncbi:MAG: Cu(I)-responsive transcriptional regulator [Pseudomonadota bacterium]
MNIGTAATAAGLPVKTVRYYADIGLISPSGRTDAGYRDYAEDEVSKLIFVRRARSFGFSIDQARELLSLYEDRNRSSADVKAIAARKLEDIDAKMSELRALRDELAHLVDACRGDNRPDCPIISGFANARKDRPSTSG